MSTLEMNKMKTAQKVLDHYKSHGFASSMVMSLIKKEYDCEIWILNETEYLYKFKDYSSIRVIDSYVEE